MSYIHINKYNKNNNKGNHFLKALPM